MKVEKYANEAIRLKRRRPTTLKEANANGMRQFEMVFTVDGVKSQQRVSAINIQKAEELIRKQYDGRSVVFTFKREVNENLNEKVFDNSDANYRLNKLLDEAQEYIAQCIKILTFKKGTTGLIDNMYDNFKKWLREVETIGHIVDPDRYSGPLQEDFETPAPGTDTGLANLIIDAINDEWEAISGYNDLIEVMSREGHEDMVKVINDIANEENTHVGQLQEILKTISSNVENIDNGASEAANQLDNTADDDFGPASGFEAYF